ncbi:MAG: AarF/ABC1/UbiB kinase family protein [Deltaproteobacteria bacterium]|nr:AarF/ABC1/UbiB kinase family protein [Deltaproteobacteria bacterium]
MRLLGRSAFVSIVLFSFGIVAGTHLLLLRVLGVARLQRQAVWGRHLRLLCQRLGATYIKLGQVLATRPDLASAPVRKALAALHDRVPPFSYRAVSRIVTAEFGQPPEQLFAEIDPYPVASASVAQVHRGRLRDGEAIALKVRRPGIERTMRSDMTLLTLVTAIIAWLPGLRRYPLRQALGEICGAIEQQLDFCREAANNRVFRQNFEGMADVVFPRLVERFCSERVLCMSFIAGEKINTLRPGSSAQAVVRTGYNAILKMIFIDGFVHADLHPGNMLVVDGNRLAFVDLGLVARVGQRQRSGLLRILAGWIGRDVAGVCAGISAAAFYGQPPADEQRLRATVEQLLERYRDRSLAEIRLAELLQDLVKVARHQWQRLDPTLTMIALAIGVVEGVGRELAPDLSIADAAAPFLGAIQLSNML